MKTTILLSVSACFSQLKWYYFSTPRRLNDLEIYDEASRGPWGAFLILLQCRKSTILTTALAITTLASLLVEPSAQQILDFQSREITQKDADVSIVNSHGFKLRFSNDSNDGYLAKTLGIRSTLVNAATGTISSFSFRCPDSATRCTYPAFTTLGICSLFHNTTDLSTQSCAYNHTTGAIFCNVLLPSTWNEIEGARPIVMGLNYTDKELVPRLYDTSPENQSAFDDIFSYGRADGQLEFTRGPYLRMSGVRLLPRFLSEPKDPQFEAFESIWYWCARTYNASTGSAEAVFPELVSTRTLTPIQPDCWESHPDFCTYSDNVTSEVYSLDGYTVWWLHRYIYYALASSFALARSSEDTSYGQSGDVADIGGYLYSVPDLDEVFQNVATQASHIIRIAGGENENTTIVEGVAFGLETYIDVRWGWVLLPFIETLLAVVLLVATIVLASKSRQPLFKSSVNALLFHGLEDSMATDLALHINDKQPLSVLQAMSRDLETTLLFTCQQRNPSKRGASGWHWFLEHVKLAKYARQIRCDRSHPCSNCQAAGIACQQVSIGSDTHPKAADRIARLEDQIKQLDHRLSEVEHQYEDRVTTIAPLRSISPSNVSIEREPRPSSLTPNNLYQGSSSFATLSAEASEAVQISTLTTASNRAQSIGESVRDLNSLIHTGSIASSLNDHYFSPISVECPLISLNPLPVNLVISVLHKIKARSAIFLHGYVISDITLIENICRRVCFPTDPVSTGLATSMYGLLYFLLREILMLGEQLESDYDLTTYVARCKENFNIGIETYNILAVPSFENILSLTLGIIMAQNEAKPFLACTLASVAASHCQVLGYHREKMYQGDHTEVSQTKRRLFWSLYVFNKNTSLLLGRSSSFQDIEIDVQYPPLSTDKGHKPWDEWFHLAIRLAKVQEQIYDKLYSPTGLQSDVEERRHHIESLEIVLHHWRTDLEQINGTYAHYPQVFSLSRVHWDIMYYSTLTCLLRGTATSSTRGEISSRCFQAARLSLQSHLHYFSKYKSSDILSDTDFANWVLHNSSFTPFIVLFLHAIATSSVNDLDLLDEVVQTLLSTRQAGKSFERLYELCATFARLARRLVAEAQPCVGDYNQGTDTLHLPDTTDQMPEYWLESLQALDGVSGEFSHEYDFDISTTFADWMNGQPISQAGPL
ncbi:hypothetical protein NUW58_g5933 [Xylaria curta]|uniref:Uncharacterized protein n=1 Tax=Xylaria curta TaxID=42375 RepID=A0ACC1NZ76_9PEZI|nr:hypothetical protein NUW58_g5933 [Xylaria curta]